VIKAEDPTAIYRNSFYQLLLKIWYNLTLVKSQSTRLDPSAIKMKTPGTNDTKLVEVESADRDVAMGNPSEPST